MVTCVPSRLAVTASVSAWGLDLGSQSGASTYVNLHYEFGTARSAHWLYGSSGADIAHAPKIYASDS
jgi:hypothetical protein